MKKRFLIPLIAIAAPIVIGVADTSIRMAGCGFGDKNACSELDRRQAEAKTGREEREAERAKAALGKSVADAVEEAKTKANSEAGSARREKGSEPESWRAEAAAESCIRERLNDPDSLRTLSSKVVAYNSKQYTVLLEYTATNSFGGRVREFGRCTINR